MAALEAEYYLSGLDAGGETTGSSMDGGDESVEGRGAAQHDQHGPVQGRRTPDQQQQQQKPVSTPSL